MYNPTKPSRNRILRLIETTWNTPYLTIEKDTYAVFKKKFIHFEVDHTDGIGTKGYYHWKKRSFKNAVHDSLAMNLNDLALVRAIPYKLQNHIVIPKDDDKAVLKIVSELVKECKKRKIAITGGETSIHNTTDGLDIGITVSGIIEKKVKNKFITNDVLIGLKSNGLHSNGITKIRELFKNEFRADFIKPTEIYLDIILKLNRVVSINGMMHITGGAFTKLKDLLNNQDVIINRDHSLNPQRIFYEVYKKGLTDKEMYKIFNCGIGFIFSVSKKEAQKVLKHIDGAVIGSVVKGSNEVVIESKFSNTEVSY